MIYESSMMQKGSDIALDERFALVDDRRLLAPPSPPSKPSALRFLLPGIYLVSTLLLLLISTGVLGPNSGFGRPVKNDLVANVTAHLQTHMSPLFDALSANAAQLEAENAQLDSLASKLDLDEGNRAAVKAKLVHAIEKVISQFV